MSARRPTRLEPSRLVSFAALALVVAATGCRLRVAWTSVATLTSKTLPDDAFYYFQIARHLAHGHGVTFDGLTPTNGFHPLWLAVISPFFGLFPTDADLPIHLTLTLATLLSVATAGLAHAITRRLTGDALAATFSLVLYTFNPYVTLEALNGLETALGNFLFAATAWYYLLRGDTMHTRQAVTLGLLAGLTILARTDNVFLFAVILLSVLSSRSSLSGLRTVLVAGGIAALVVAPWVAWCAAVAGSAIQSSGLAVPFVLHGNIVPELGTDSLPRWIAAETLEGIRLALRYSGAPWSPLPFVLVLSAVAIFDVRGDRSLRVQLGRLNFVVVTLLALVAFHSSYRLYPRGWYFVPVALLSAVYLGILVAHLRAAFSRRGAGLALSAGAMLVAASVNGIHLRALWQEGVYPWQAEMLSAAQWVGAHTTAADRIGAFNAGIIGYWNADRTVINLDGVVNSAAFDAIRERRLWAYVRDARIAYLVDYEQFLFASPANFSATYVPYLGESLKERVDLVDKLPGTLGGFDMVILKVHMGG